ncbi:MAG TPA: hypothetical protein VK673_13355 [Chthoniobacterales bacterium]|nr:hypothetical protein [Chthoniobacterales bacterium]
MDVPLQVLLLQLPPEVTKSNIDIDPKRRVQIPRKSLQIDEAHQTAKVTFATLFASCPEIFSVPIAPLDQRTLEFNLPAWERSRLAESGEQITSPTATTPSESSTPTPAETREPAKVSDRLPPLPVQQLLGETQPVPGQEKLEKAPLGGAARNGSEVPKTVRVALAPIIKNLPSELQPSDPNALANKPGATIELPFELINSQLANGRVTIPFSTLLKSLPEDARRQFPQADTAAEVAIPVKDILQDYPQDLLRPRADQEPEETLPAIATPFAGPAKEDTERFANAPEEREPEKVASDSHQLELIEHPATPSEAPQPVSEEAPVAEEKRDAVEKPASEERPAGEQKPAPNFSALQSVFLTDEPLDLNKVVQKVGDFPGIHSALFFAADGSLEGEPEKLGLTQSSVQLLSSLTHEVGQRVENLGFGQIETVTLGWKRELVSVFTRGESGFLVRHEKRPFKPGVREKICLVLSHICS